MNFSFTPIQPLSIHPDEAVSIFHSNHKKTLILK
jgi:hypothetical protein